MSDDDFMAQSDDEEYDFVRAAGSIFLSRLSKDALLIIITDIYIYIYITLVHCTRACVPLHSCRTTIQTTMAQMLGLQT